MAPPAVSRLEISLQEGIALVAFNRPEARNAIDDVMRSELADAIDWVRDDENVRALVLTGRGPAFCAGGDIKGMQERLKSPPGTVAGVGWRRQRGIHRTVTALHDLSKPTIAAVNGAAAGLGCDLTLACDFIVAAEAASFVMSFVLRGLIPDGGGMYFLPRRIGLPAAKDMIFSGRTVKADEALTLGLADEVVAGDKLIDAALALAKRMSAAPPTALALAKNILDRSFELTLDQALALGSQAQAMCYTTDEHRDAVDAFVNKRGR
jgi:enoyl-CoA hydratase/carnithine racemase